MQQLIERRNIVNVLGIGLGRLRQWCLQREFSARASKPLGNPPAAKHYAAAAGDKRIAADATSAEWSTGRARAEQRSACAGGQASHISPKRSANRVNNRRLHGRDTAQQHCAAERAAS